MHKLTRAQRALAAAVIAFTGWGVSRWLFGESLGISSSATGFLFAVLCGGIVFWLAEYKDPEIENGRRS